MTRKPVIVATLAVLLSSSGCFLKLKSDYDAVAGQLATCQTQMQETVANLAVKDADLKTCQDQWQEAMKAFGGEAAKTQDVIAGVREWKLQVEQKLPVQVRAEVEGQLNKLVRQLETGFGALATELRTGRTVVFDRGAVAPAVRASSAIPGVFSPVEIGGVTYVDGGVTDPVPAHVARARGAELVIAVAIPPAVPPEPPRNPVAVAYHAVALMAAEIGRLRAAEADVVIEPAVGDVGYDDFTRRKQLIEAGESAAREALPAIRAALAARSRPVAVRPASP